MTAHWLRRMGHDAVALGEDVSGMPGLAEGDDPAPEQPRTLPELSPAELGDAIAGGAVLLDLNPSMAYRAGHIAGARWAIRPRLDRLGLAPGARVVLIADDRRVAELAAIDLREQGIDALSYASGAALPMTATPHQPADVYCIDFLFFVHDRHNGSLDAARAYLAWETGLVDQLDAEERAAFQL
jgi:hypothetical protein